MKTCGGGIRSTTSCSSCLYVRCDLCHFGCATLTAVFASPTAVQTMCETFLIGIVSSFFDTTALIYMLAAVAVVSLGLIAFACQVGACAWCAVVVGCETDRVWMCCRPRWTSACV